MSQTDFAKAVGVTSGYINIVINGRRNWISESLALLIEVKFGYSAKWLLHSEGEKKVRVLKTLEQLNTQIIKRVNALSPEDIEKVLQYITRLEEQDEQERDKNSLGKQRSM
jgi:transcriptional regulator with XRE-family HTH domain